MFVGGKKYKATPGLCD